MTMTTTDNQGEVANERGRSAARRARHDPGTKQARNGHEKGMVWARFFPPSGCTTPAPVSACAAAKSFVSPRVTRTPPGPPRDLVFMRFLLRPLRKRQWFNHFRRCAPRAKCAQFIPAHSCHSWPLLYQTNPNPPPGHQNRLRALRFSVVQSLLTRITERTHRTAPSSIFYSSILS